MTDTGAPRRIGLLTTGRQDWGILHSTARSLDDDPRIALRLFAGGMHLSERHGSTIELVRSDGFVPVAELPWVQDDAAAHVQAAGALAAVGDALAAHPVDAIVLAGDRFETAAAGIAATIARVPIVHVHGGEQTLGAFDDVLRHALTKLSHLHLVAHEDYRRRVIALGEDPASVHVVGAPSLDAAFRTDLPGRAELETALGATLRAPVVLVTVHPATLEADPEAASRAVVGAMEAIDATYVITAPNVDPGAAGVRAALMAAARTHPDWLVVDSLGEARYWGLMAIADAMLGNSSSGIIEAPAVDLPAVNVGDRQAGRRRDGNVLDVPADASAAIAGLRLALDPAFRAGVVRAHPVLADGRAGARIADIIAGWQPPVPPHKRPIPVP